MFTLKFPEEGLADLDDVKHGIQELPSGTSCCELKHADEGTNNAFTAPSCEVRNFIDKRKGQMYVHSTYTEGDGSGPQAQHPPRNHP